MAVFAFSLMHTNLFFNNFRGNWKVGPQKQLGRDLKGSTVGIVGLGGIGQTVVKRLQGFNVESIVYCGNREKPEGTIHYTNM